MTQDAKRSEEIITDRFTTWEAVQVDLDKLGFTAVTKPVFNEPTAYLDPEILDNPADPRYHYEIAQREAWLTYTSSLLADVESKIDEANNRLKVLGPLIRNRNRTEAASEGRKKPSEDSLKDVVPVNYEHINAQQDHQKYAQARRMLAARVEMYTRHLTILSRALTRADHILRASETSQRSLSGGPYGRA